MSDAATKAPASPKASRLTLPRWLDPKLLLGVLLVVVAMLLGARVLAGADHTVPVYQVKADMFTGDALTPESVAVTNVHFSDASVADNYVSADSALPTGQVVNRDVHAGEMLTQSSVSPKTKTPTVQVSVPVDAADLAMVTENSRIDVIVVPKSTSANAKATPTKVLSNVLVTSVPDSAGGGFSASGAGNGASIVVRVDPASQKGFDSVTLAGQLDDSSVFIVELESQSP